MECLRNEGSLSFGRPVAAAADSTLIVGGIVSILSYRVSSLESMFQSFISQGQWPLYMSLGRACFVMLHELSVSF